ncbi:MAG: dUTP diphosphatase [Firmicutes bacterium]|nr:dUTP diphosphatase [Bacillota bacterium]
MNIQLKPLVNEQAKLDAHIQSQHQVTYQTTREKRILALLVEVGEMINETKTFKFWSKKPSAEKPIILDEYADGLHFLLSLGIEIQSQKMIYEIQPLTLSLTQATIIVFQHISDLSKHWHIKHLENAFQAYLNLMPLLGFNSEDVIEAYFKKLGVNYTRQQNAY